MVGFCLRNVESMKHKITTLLGLCAVFGLTHRVLAEDTTPPPAKPPGEGKEKHSPAEHFKKLDTDGNGSLSKEEFMARVAKAPAAEQEKLKKRLEERFTQLDTNKDGSISLEEFIAGAPKPGEGGPGGRHHGPGGKPPGDKPPGEPAPAPAPPPPAAQ